MRRVPSDLVLLLLAQEAERSNRPWLRIKPTSLRNWTHRYPDQVTRTAEGYDLEEIMSFVDRREQRKRQQRASA